MPGPRTWRFWLTGTGLGAVPMLLLALAVLLWPGRGGGLGSGLAALTMLALLLVVTARGAGHVASKRRAWRDGAVVTARITGHEAVENPWPRRPKHLALAHWATDDGRTGTITRARARHLPRPAAEIRLRADPRDGRLWWEGEF